MPLTKQLAAHARFCDAHPSKLGVPKKLHAGVPKKQRINFFKEFASAVYPTQMAAKYLRKQTWWVRFYDPRTSDLVRESLGTSDEAKAELLRQRVELEAALLSPRFQAAEVPDNVRKALGWVPGVNVHGEAQKNEASLEVTAASPVLARPATRVLLDDALRGYFAFVRTENAVRHVENKLSMLRRFLGVERAEQFSEEGSPDIRQRRLKNGLKPFFEGKFLDEVTPTLLQGFFDQLGVSKKTKRHYREFFHHFFEHCIKFGLFRPDNFHCPNPTAALPTYLSRNRRIVFLDQDQIDEQLRVLEPYPAMRAAVAIMIHAGLRRAETLWLAQDALSQDLSFLSVLNRVDQETDIESSLKTGERAVTILHPLKCLLEEYLAGHRSNWLVTSSTGSRWNGDAFGRRLRSINAKAGLKWTCLHYRHTYATRRAAEGWPLFRIAKEMGNSVAVVEEYYAGFIRPTDAGAPPRNGELHVISSAVA